MTLRLIGELSNDYGDDDDNDDGDDPDYSDADADNAGNVTDSVVEFTIIHAGVCGCDGNVFRIKKRSWNIRVRKKTWKAGNGGNHETRKNPAGIK